MKTVTFLVVLSLFLCRSFATNYYIAANGSNNNSGTSKAAPFQTIAAFNTLVLQPGDSILFRRGDVFRGQLTIKQSGTAANPIAISSYGTGVRAIISGSELVTNFATTATPNIFSATLTSEPPTVFYNGNVNFPARYPNSGFLTVDVTAPDPSTSFYDQALNQSSGYWNGATVHNRIYAYQYVENKVRDFSNGTVFLQTPTTMTHFEKNWGYYFSNKLSLLDTAGEFYYDAGQQKLFLYATTKPSNVAVQASVYSYGIYLQGAAYITINNINFIYQKGSGVSSTDNNTNITINSCRFGNIYGKAISFNNVDKVVITDNDILDIYSKGIIVNKAKTVTIQNNNIRRIGLYAGRATEKNDEQISYSGMEVEGDVQNGNISLNTLDSVGYNGIRFSVHTLIEKNVISNYCLTSNDGSAIYTYNGIGTFPERRGTACIIKNNIIRDGIGNLQGSPDLTPSANGIYMDGASGRATITYNTINHPSAVGIFLNSSSDNNVQNNTVFNSGSSSLLIVRYQDSVPVVNDTVSNNIFYLLKKDQFNMSLSNQIDTTFNFGTFSGNSYHNPYSDAVISKLLPNLPPDSQLIYSVKQWKTIEGTATGSYVRWNDYKVINTGDTNLITNGTFNTDKDSWFCRNENNTCTSTWGTNAKLNGGSIHAQCNDGVLYTTAPFELIANQKYLLSFSSNAIKDENITVWTNQAGPTSYNKMDFLRTFLADTGRHENVVAFNSTTSFAQCRINLMVTKNSPDYWLDNVTLYKVDAELDDPLTRNLLYTNATSDSQTYALPQTLYRLDNTTVSGTISLPPFTSLILLKKTGASSTARTAQVAGMSPSRVHTVKLFPNPARNVIILETEAEMARQIVICDAIGRVVMQVKNTGTKRQSVNVSNLLPGVYFVILGSEKLLFMKQ